MKVFLRLRLLWCALAVLTCVTGLSAQIPASWTTPFPPFRILGNIYYVGSQDLASYLIVTPSGDVLINSNLPSSVPQIRHSVEQLGFHFRDIKVLLISHAHYDHAAGSAAILRLTGAKYEVMEGDAAVVESGGRTDFAYGRSAASRYPPAKVDRVLHDGDEVRLGGTVLVAHRTAGHTRGCTTWTLQVEDKGRRYNVVIVGSPNVNPGYRLTGHESYPGIAKDYRATFRTLRNLPCDVFLGAHGSYFGMIAKYDRLSTGKASANPFLDPKGYQAYVDDRESAFQAAVTRQLERHR